MKCIKREDIKKAPKGNSCNGIGNSWVYNGRYRISKANVDYGLERNRLTNHLEALMDTKGE